MYLSFLAVCTTSLLFSLWRIGGVDAAASLVPVGSTSFTFSDHRMPHSDVEAFCKLHGKRPAMIPMPKLPLVTAAMYTRYNGPATAWSGYENMKSSDSSREVVIHVYDPIIFAPGAENKNLYNYAICE